MKVVKNIPVINTVKELQVVTFTTSANALIHIKRKDDSIKNGKTLAITSEKRFKLMDVISNVWTKKPIVSRRVYTDKESYIEITYCKYRLKEFIKLELYRFSGYDKMELEYDYDRVTLTKEQSRLLFRVLRGT